MKQSLLLSLSALLLISCSDSQEIRPSLDRQAGIEIWGQTAIQFPEERILKIVNQNGAPIANAQILIGSGLDQPFVNNFITTDGQGVFIAPAEWTEAQPLTISATGYIRATYLGQVPQGQTLTLRLSDKVQKLKLTGQGTGFRVVDRDDLIDFALMIPALKRDDLFSFSLNTFMSPDLDKIEAAGREMYIPSNISLPKQRERYLFVNVEMEKPVYRLEFDSPGSKWVYAARGQFPFKKMVGEMRDGKSFLDLVNLINIQGGSLKQIDLTSPNQVADLPVNELNFNSQRSYRAPSIRTDDYLLVASASEFQSIYFPTDIKNLTSNQTMNLKTAAGSEPFVLTALSKKSELESGNLRISTAFESFVSNRVATLLPLIEQPQVRSENQWSLRPISAPNGLFPKATYAVLSRVEKRQQGQSQITLKERLWEVYGQGWINTMTMPVWPTEDKFPAGPKRWEVSLTASSSQNSIAIGPRLLENVTHATRAQTDF